LSLYDDVKANAQGIYERRMDGSMPCDEPWPGDHIALFRRRMPSADSVYIAHRPAGIVVPVPAGIFVRDRELTASPRRAAYVQNAERLMQTPWFGRMLPKKG
jgi:hypothetical protein